MTSAVGDSHLPESLSGPCGWFRYHELNRHKVTLQSMPSPSAKSTCDYSAARRDIDRGTPCPGRLEMMSLKAAASTTTAAMVAMVTAEMVRSMILFWFFLVA